MIKAAVLALLLGLATSSTITGWTGPENAAAGDRYVFLDEMWGQAKAFYEVDFGWSTHYKGTRPGETVANIQAESYGVNLYSDILFNLDITAAGMYHNNLRFYLEPFMVAPYTQTIAWQRFESGEFHTFLAGSRTIRLANFFTVVTENTEVGKTSLYQALFNDGDYVFNQDQMFKYEDFQNKYIDPYWSKNLLEALTPELFQDLTDNKILGDVNYYNV